MQEELSEDGDTVQSSGGDGRKRSSTEDAEAEPIFIPLGWPRSSQGELYAASDPEWLEFVKIARDQEKLRILRGPVISILLFWLH